MIVIFEGANGVGKTTYIDRLTGMLNIRTFRPWLEAKTACKQNGTRSYGALDNFGIPVNTHVDDFYVADFVGAFNLDVVLDRSLPSAIVYGTLPGADAGTEMAMLKYWQLMIKRASQNRVLYIWLNAPYETCKERLEGERWYPKKAEYEKLHKQYERIFHAIKLPKIQINTGDTLVDTGMKRICQALKT